MTTCTRGVLLCTTESCLFDHKHIFFSTNTIHTGLSALSFLFSISSISLLMKSLVHLVCFGTGVLDVRDPFWTAGDNPPPFLWEDPFRSDEADFFCPGEDNPPLFFCKDPPRPDEDDFFCPVGDKPIPFLCTFSFTSTGVDFFPAAAITSLAARPRDASLSVPFSEDAEIFSNLFLRPTSAFCLIELKGKTNKKIGIWY